MTLKPEHIIKDPYVLEFLNLNPNLKYLEKDLEKALLDKLQQFLLESQHLSRHLRQWFCDCRLR
ncbi:MAG: DUF1016 domain-containing protein [bacterium]|nr:DUF1016 domain-containing protein [bacterium]